MTTQTTTRPKATTNGNDEAKLLKDVETTFAAYVKAFSSEGQAAWLAYHKGSKGPEAAELKAKAQALFPPETQEAWKAYEAARAAYRTAMGKRAPVMRFPKAT